MKAGAIFIIGAGPGDPGLMTARGLEYLSSADVIVYDHAINRRLLRSAKADAELIDVGGSSPKAVARDAICFLLVEKAREGKTVARLKWGDPFVFEGGGEEALFLHEQGMKFEVVPGVPAATGMPPYAGVPITYTGGGDALTIIRGYEDGGKALPDVDWNALARLDGTVACYAGGPQLPRILEALTTHGWPAETPAVIIYNGTLATQDTKSGSLGDFLTLLRDNPRREPALLVVGRTVSFRDHLRWFDQRPLFGKRILVTRPRAQAGELIDRLAAFGAEAVEAPMIRIVPPEDSGPLEDAASRVSEFDWIVFTSVNAVEAFMQTLLSGDRDVRAMKGPRICTVGIATAEKLTGYHIKVDLVPPEFKAEAAFDALRQQGSLDGARILLPRADIGRDVLTEELRRSGAVVTDVVAYRTVLDEGQREGDPDIYGMLLERRIDTVTFTSASAIRNFVKVYGAEQTADLLRKIPVAVIGPVTAEAVAKAGIEVSIQPQRYTIAALVDAIAEHFSWQHK